MTTTDRHYQTVAAAIRYMREHQRQQPGLAELSAAVGVSESQLQRIFSAWAGISPKRFLQYLTKEHALAALRESRDVLDASIDAGLSGPGRLHDLMVTCEAMSPGEISSGGDGVTLSYGVAETPFGEALLGWTSRGLCHLAFCDDETDEQLAQLSALWPAAEMSSDDAGASVLGQRIFYRSGQNKKAGDRLHLLLRGSNFQIKVWQALLRIGSGQLASYSTLARLAGSPRAQRTVGSALAQNRIAYLIPCHRVIRESGEVGQFRWGPTRKSALQAWEAAKQFSTD